MDAKQEYDRRFQAISEILQSITKGIDFLKSRADAKKQYWDFPGTLAHVRESLDFVLKFLGHYPPLRKKIDQYMSSAAAMEGTYKDCMGAITSIQETLKSHSLKAARKPDNWGFTGDLGNVEDSLGDIRDFLRPRSKLHNVMASVTKRLSK